MLIYYIFNHKIAVTAWHRTESFEVLKYLVLKKYVEKHI